MKRKRRFFAITFAVTILPFLLLSSLFYSSSVLRDQLAAMEYTLRQTADMIDRTLGEVALLSDMLCVNPVVQEYLRTDGQTQSKNEQIDEMRTLETVIARCYQSDAVYDMRLYLASDKFYTSEQIQFFPMNLFEQEEGFSDISSQARLSSVQTRDYKNKGSQRVITHYRLITNTRILSRTLGALCVDIPVAALTQYMTLPRGTGLGTLALLYPDGSGVLPDVPDATGFDMSKISLSSPGGHREGMDAVFSVPLEEVDWILVGRLENAYALFGDVSNAAFWVALGVLMALVLCVVFGISGAFARRIDQLLDLLDPRAVTSLTVHAPTDSGGMLDMLNHAVVRARELLEEQRRQMVLQQQTQLKLLQAQINPHFLYNALDCVNWLILDGERARASEMVLSVARYYRLALSKGRDELTLEEDLDLAVTYAQIQECRLRGHIQIHAHIQDAVRGCLIPKMSIQPVVENSIIHGFQKQLDDAHIDIDAYAADGYVCIAVSDNGKGMDADTEVVIPPRESATGGFGLHSVHQRCILFSGDDSCGVSIESEKDAYTIVTIRVSCKK